jgi:hypothetical protein
MRKNVPGILSSASLKSLVMSFSSFVSSVISFSSFSSSLISFTSFMSSVIFLSFLADPLLGLPLPFLTGMSSSIKKFAI